MRCHTLDERHATRLCGLCDKAALLAAREDGGKAKMRRLLAHARVAALRRSAEFEHVAESGDLPARKHLGERLQGRACRCGTRIVGVVDEGVCAALFNGEAHLLRRRHGESAPDIRERKAEHASRSNGGERIRHVVSAGHRQEEFVPFQSPALVFPFQHESHAVLGLADSDGTHISIARKTEGHDAHARLRLLAHREDARIVGVQYDRAARLHCLDKLRLRLRDVLDRAEKLHVHLADVRHDGNGRRGERRERGDLPESSHADLDDSRLVRGAKAKERQRQADLVVIVRRRLLHKKACAEHSSRQVFGRRLAV